MNFRLCGGLFVAMSLGVLLGFSPVSASPPSTLLKVLSVPPDTGTLPEEPLTTLHGETVALRSRTGLTVINFWATWCGPCREELNHLDDLHRRFDGRILRFVAVNVGETRAVATRYVREQELSLPVVLDPDRRLHKLYEPRQYFPLPRTVLVEDGSLIANNSGVLPFGERAVRQAFRNYARDVRMSNSVGRAP